MTARAYGQPAPPTARRWSATDRRYSSYRWRVRTRLPVLRRDGYRCWAAGCPRRADVCDHIYPVTKATTDAEFFDATRLRASCRQHNLARALLTDSELSPTPGPSEVVTRDYSRPRR